MSQTRSLSTGRQARPTFRNPTVKINGRFATRRMTGVERYATEICSRLPEEAELVAPRGECRGVRGLIWEQGALCGRLNGALLWSPCNTGPLAIEKQVVTIHDCAFLDQAGCFSRRAAWLFGWLIPRLARRVRRIITVSEFSKGRLRDRLGIEERKIAVIPNGVDSRFRPMGDDDVYRVRRILGLSHPYVLCVGSLEPRKNLGRLLESWRRIAATRGDRRLVLVGGTNATFRDSGLDIRPDDHVIQLGHVADLDLPSVYTAAELFVYPSLYEGFGLPPLEALACGTPVITSSTTSLPEVVGDAAWLADPSSVDSIAGGIQRLLDDATLRASLRQRGIERARAFCWDRTARLTWDVLSEANEAD